MKLLTMIVGSTLNHCLRLKFLLTGHANDLCSAVTLRTNMAPPQAGLLVSMTKKHRLESVALLGPGSNTENKGN